MALEYLECCEAYPDGTLPRMMSDHVITLLKSELERHEDLKKRCKAYQQLSVPADFADIVRELAVRLELAEVVAAHESTGTTRLRAAPTEVAEADAAEQPELTPRAVTAEQVARRARRSRAATKRLRAPPRGLVSAWQVVLHTVLAICALARAAVELLIRMLLEGVGIAGPVANGVPQPKAPEGEGVVRKRGRSGRQRKK
eukprot:1540539-Prymnesium_polylepis.1